MDSGMFSAGKKRRLINMVTKEVREEARKYVTNGELRDVLRSEGLSEEAVDYIIHAVLLYRRF